MTNDSYERLKNFYRVKSLSEIFKKKQTDLFFEEETLFQIKKNISNFREAKEKKRVFKNFSFDKNWEIL
jgi:hypothetical protein